MIETGHVTSRERRIENTKYKIQKYKTRQEKYKTDSTKYKIGKGLNKETLVDCNRSCEYT